MGKRYWYVICVVIFLFPIHFPYIFREREVEMTTNDPISLCVFVTRERCILQTTSQAQKIAFIFVIDECSLMGALCTVHNAHYDIIETFLLLLTWCIEEVEVLEHCRIREFAIFYSKVLHIGRMFDWTIIAMKMRFSPFDPQRMDLVDALYHLYHFMTKISKLAGLWSHDKDGNFSADFT